MRAAHEHHLPHSDYLRWDRDDRAAEDLLAEYDDECCSRCGVHPSAWSTKHGGNPRRPAVQAVWTHCLACQLWQDAESAGPPVKEQNGWRLVWRAARYDRNGRLIDD